MSIVEHLRDAVSLALRNWPVIIVNLIVAVINCAGAVFFVLLPLSGLLMLAGISPLLLTHTSSYDALLGQIPYVAALAVVFMLIYLCFLVCIGLFVLAGTTGIVVFSARNPAEGFSLNRFFSEARRLFFPFLNYTGLTGGLLVLVAVLSVVAGFFVKGLVEYLQAYSAALSYFVGLFSVVVGGLVLFSILLLLLVITFYGLIELAISNEGTMEAFRKTINFIKKQGGAIGYFLLVGVIYIAVNLVLGAFGLTFKLTPFGFLLSIPFQFVSYLVSAAVGLWFISALVSYYLGCRGEGVACRE